MSDLAGFCEAHFLPHPIRAAAYSDCVARGRESASNRRVVIGALARDVAPVLPATMARIERTGELFADYRVVVFENDSVDDTAEQLEAWARMNPKVHALIERRGDPANQQIRCLRRAERMAVYRNKCREYIIAHFPEYDNVILVETDLPGGWSYDGILHTFGLREPWHMVGSNGMIFKTWNGVIDRPLQFDVWAFRWPDSWTAQRNTQINPRYWPRGDPLVPLNSCFGGLGVYVMDAMFKSGYDGTDCEHVPFHRGMKEAGLDRIYMNPSQIVLYSPCL